MAMTVAELKKTLHKAGIKTYKNSRTKASCVKKTDVKEFLNMVADKKSEASYDEVEKRFPDMDNSETWEDYLERKRDDLSKEDITFLEEAIKTWWEE